MQQAGARQLSTCQPGCPAPHCGHRRTLLCNTAKRDAFGYPHITALGMLLCKQQMHCACSSKSHDSCWAQLQTAPVRLQALLEDARGGVLRQARRIGLRAASSKGAVPAGRQLLRRRRQRAQDHVAYLRRARGQPDWLCVCSVSCISVSCSGSSAMLLPLVMQLRKPLGPQVGS